MSTAADVVRRALRLINVPGRGASLSADDLAAGFVTLREIVASESVGRALQHGIRRHFIALAAGQSSFSYGPGADLDTDLFGDPTPIGIEQAFVRVGGGIVTNELVTNGAFVGATGWTLGAWVVVNNTARIVAGNAGSILSQPIALAARTYEVRVTVRRRAGSVVLGLVGTGGSISQTIASSGVYTFEVTPTASSTSAITFDPDATADLDLDLVSVRPRGLDAVSLAPGGTDAPVRLEDHRTAARRASKDTGGSPRALFFSRSYPDARVELNRAPSGGEILIIDARVNLADPTTLASEVRLHPDALKWLSYRLAFEVAPEYGKSLRNEQVAIMTEAYEAMAAANARANTLRVDPALASPRRGFNIDTV